MLGLRIDPATFAGSRATPLLAPLLARAPGLRVIQSATVFEALSWAIIGQQINLTFAIALRRTSSNRPDARTRAACGAIRRPPTSPASISSS